ncbi:TIGR02453 family protein [Bernardetia litoralis DSM 6794]|uniref:TIGR02453 family protein n=1 Tax=Bernardetia litoralis (strain ATCC 23117 / DSM 6794 / NBRC 15988 / NCIMB 1366 / Fx l1 / Sio-4) TaxID=880071 RepID=I4AM45_BERLS|nr:DUF2461 domain-containing protein [Bernardetia litoralis]AFM05030.1 TIGR02453 family protein [Bernardetia litoralis DSM 6794]
MLPLTLTFLKKLHQNNNREWFKEHKKEYETAKAEFSVLVTALLEYFTNQIDPAFSTLTAKDCIFRLNRDVRFSKDKTPYKTYFSAVLHPEGRKTEKPLIYLHIAPTNNSFLAVGVFQPNKEYLKKIREEIDYNADELKAIFNKKEFKNYFNNFEKMANGVLKTAPRGYPKDHENIELLRLKHFVVQKSITDKQLLSNNISTKIAEIAMAGQSLNGWLNVVWEETVENLEN